MQASAIDYHWIPYVAKSFDTTERTMTTAKICVPFLPSPL
jgi:hypothetical protein